MQPELIGYIAEKQTTAADDRYANLAPLRKPGKRDVISPLVGEVISASPRGGDRKKQHRLSSSPYAFLATEQVNLAIVHPQPTKILPENKDKHMPKNLTAQDKASLFSCAP